MPRLPALQLDQLVSTVLAPIQALLQDAFEMSGCQLLHANQGHLLGTLGWTLPTQRRAEPIRMFGLRGCLHLSGPFLYPSHTVYKVGRTRQLPRVYAFDAFEPTYRTRAPSMPKPDRHGFVQVDRAFTDSLCEPTLREYYRKRGISTEPLSMAFEPYLL